MLYFCIEYFWRAQEYSLFKIMKISILKFFLYIFSLTFIFVGCQKQGCTDPLASNYDNVAEKDDNSCIYDGEEFDKQGLLLNITENYIIPSINQYRNNVISLDSLVDIFTQQPTEQGLVNLRNSWINTLLSWQDISFLDFGPADYILLKKQTNVFPADTILIESNINSGTWNLSYTDNFDAKGFQALDYLLNKRGLTEAERVTFLTSNQSAKDYLNDITDDLLSNINYVSDQWTSSYKDDFINDFQTNASGSSISVLINALCLHYEFYVRRGKVGLPLGIFNGFSQLEMPELVECYHYGQSLPFAIRAVESVKKYVNGSHYVGQDVGIGLDDYMDFVNATIDSEDLSLVINNQLDNIVVELNGLHDPFSDQMINNKPELQATYAVMQQLVPYIKVDMTSALGVLITYADNDGD